MSVRVFRRPPRAALPPLPRGEIQLQPPPTLPRGGGGQAANQLMFMIPTMLGMGMMSFFYIGRSSAVLTVLFAVLYVGLMVGMIIMVLGRGAAQKRAQINDERRDYLRYLANTRKEVREAAVEQRRVMLLSHPEPAGLTSLVASERLWERRRTDRDAFHVRVGSGPKQLATPLLAPKTAPLEDLDPVASTSLRHFVRTYSSVPDLPIAVAVRSFAQVVVEGDRAVARDLVRSWLANLATFHSPDDLRIAVYAASDRLDEWDWLKWLPHAQHAHRQDAAGPLRMVTDSAEELAALLEADLGGRPRFSRAAVGAGTEHAQVVLVLDADGVRPGGPLVPEGGLAGVTLVDPTGTLPPSARDTELRLVVDPSGLGIVGEERVEHVGRPDRLDPASAQALARQLAPIQVPQTAPGESSLTTNLGLPELLGIGDPRRFETEVSWAPRSVRDRLRIPLGLDPGGSPVELDLKESAEGGMGPHGLVIGATGSGKSELLRTLVVGLAATHSSGTLNFVLVDFKGGATFTGLSTLPHTSAVITNLADDLALVDRMREALHGELIRRQELLKSAGNYASARDYERAREAGASLDPLPTLLVVIDEFSELLSSKPDFIELFVMIGRLGRSLGVHLLLASQRLEEGRLRGLDSHLSYRIGLRTFSAGESRTVLGVPDAYELPSVPGSAFLKADTSTLIRFKAAYVSGLLPPDGDPADPVSVPVMRRVVSFGVRPAAAEASDAVETRAAQSLAPVLGDSVLDAMVRRIEGQGPPAHRVWLPPLDEPPSLDRLLPPLGPDPDRGLSPVGWAGNYKLSVPVGIIDKPFEQRRDLLWANLGGAAGNAIVVGAPRSGKSTFLRTLVCSLALTHTPAEVQVFCLDFGGGTLAALADLPHVGGVADRQDEERCRRIVATLTKLLADRENLFRTERLDSMEAFRRRYGARGDAQGFGDVFLVVDNWLTLRQDFEPLEEPIAMLANRGLGYGIHVVAAANRWWDVRTSIRDIFSTRLELRLGDPSDSEIDRRAAINVPQDSPGRGLTADRRQCLLALPRIDDQTTVDDLSEGVASLVSSIKEAAPSSAPKVGLLPRLLDVAELPTDGPPLRVPIGIGESELEVVSLDLEKDGHLVVYGEAECGKTGLLRLILRHLTARTAPEQVRILVADYRRNLIDAVDSEHVIGYAGSAPALASDIAEAANTMRGRLPGPGVTTEQLRNRSWWSGPRLVVLVDDYDLVAGAASNPLLPLVDLLAQARDIDLNLVVTRRSGGAGRAMFDPVLGRLRELGSPGLVMSGTRDEGALVGDVKPGPQPPGRGWLVRRRHGPELVQLAHTPPAP